MFSGNRRCILIDFSQVYLAECAMFYSQSSRKNSNIFCVVFYKKIISVTRRNAINARFIEHFVFRRYMVLFIIPKT